MRSLTFKLILAFLIVALTGVALVAIFAVLTTAVQFDRFVVEQYRENFVDQFSAYYLTNGGWDGIDEVVPFFGRYSAEGPFPFRIPAGQRPGQREAGPITLVDNQDKVVLPGLGYHSGDIVSASDQAGGTPIVVDGEEVGRLLLTSAPTARAPVGAGSLFLNRVNRGLILGVIGATVVALLLGVLLARTLSQPIRELTDATRAVAQGELRQEVPVRSRDELGELAASFNQMSADLTRARDLRRQMTADIAHDLRTPISVILGHSEALSEGVLPPSPETYHVMHEEALRLSKMVEELRTLSLAQAGELELTIRPVAPQDLLTRTAGAYAPQAEKQDVELAIDVGDNLPDIFVDPDRMAQVLDNLVSNALRYSPSGGHIQLSAHTSPQGVRLAVQDNGPGIPSGEIPYIFDRFYRGDKSRHRRQGGSGLGLAIARSIVEAHNGRIWATSDSEQGMCFTVEFSAAERT